MGYSSLIGTEHAAEEPPGRDIASLGPGDSSDTGSDMAGVAESDDGDPGLPVDVAMRDDAPHAAMAPENLGGAASDAAGTGERRSAGLDAGEREAADIGVDRVFSLDAPGEGDEALDEDIDEDEDPDLAFVDAAQAGDPLEDEATDEEVEDDEGGDAERTADEDDGIPGAQARERPAAARKT